MCVFANIQYGKQFVYMSEKTGAVYAQHTQPLTAVDVFSVIFH